MSRDNITPKEEQLLRTEDGAFAVILGYLKAERGKVAPSVFNKLSRGLGYNKMTKTDLVDFVADIEKDEGLYSLYVKAYERVIKLDDVPNYDEVVGTVPEADVFSQVTSFLVNNEDNNARLREMRKLQREGIYMKILMDNLKNHLTDELMGMPRAKYLTTPVPQPTPGDRSMILGLSDWHIGAFVVNQDTGGYDFNKLQGSLQEIIAQVIDLVNELNIKHLYVFHVGDLIEHISMRNVNQAFESEFPATQQIAKGTRVLVDVLMQLSKHTHVTFGMVAGNHDRFEGNKNDKIYNDNAVYVVLDTLFMLQDTFGQLPNVTLIDNREDTYSFTIRVAGKNIRVGHGDHESKKTDVKIPKHIKNEPIDYYIMGHIHTNRIIQEDYSRFHIYISSPMGGNNFSKELNLPTTDPSQMVLVLTEGKKSPWFIPLMDI